MIDSLDKATAEAVASELDRIAEIAHDTAQTFTTAALRVRADDYAFFARMLRERAAQVRSEAVAS